jgi:flavin prenyltransferase
MKFIIAMTGASGAIYALRLMQKIASAEHDIALVLSEPACVSLAAETDIKISAHSPDVSKLLPSEYSHRIKTFNPRDIGAAIASGSNFHDGMIVVPCSTGTLGRIAHGTSEDLIGRAADVTLKERRKLILVVRESPFSLVHLRNMQLAAEAGALILPANPHWYHRPQTPEEVADTVVDRILDQLGVQSDTKRWRSDELSMDD